MGNDEYLGCQGNYTYMEILLHNSRFTLSLLALPIHGVDIMLGVELLYNLGPIIADFSIPCMSFIHKGNLVHLSRNFTVSHASSS